MELVTKCSVCLINNTPLINSWDTDHNNIKWSYKLKLCVPEVEFSEDYLICKKCINQLEAAYEFRDLCLKSYTIQKYLNKSNKSDTDATYLDNSTSLLHNCQACTEIFKSSTEFVQHNINVHLTAECPYNCIYCGKDFKTNLELTQHELTHFNLIDYKNGYNSYNFSSLELDCQKVVEESDLNYIKLLYAENIINKNSDITYNCYNCGKSFNTKMLLIDHLEACKFLNMEKAEINVQNKNVKAFYGDTRCNNFSIEEENKTDLFDQTVSKTNQCSLNKENKSEDIFRTEGIGHDKDNPVNPTPIEKRLASATLKKRGRKTLDQTSNTCPLCGVTFNTRYLAKRHIRNVHATEKNFQCNMCEQKFASLVYLNAHKRYHSGERPHICSFCGKRFITGSDLYHHEKIHANKRAYKCEKCSKAFNTSSDLHKHKLCVHLDRNQWKYICNFCDRRFPLKTNLDAHTKTHTGERNFACHLCERKCVNRSVLMRHLKSHSNVRLYKCGLCQLEYKYQKSLDIHMTKVHGIGNAKIPERIKKYFCHICPKSYFANNKLQKHIRTHTGERPFSCQMCEKRFIDKSYVKQHLKTAHNVTFCQTDT